MNVDPSDPPEKEDLLAFLAYKDQEEYLDASDSEERKETEEELVKEDQANKDPEEQQVHLAQLVLEELDVPAKGVQQEVLVYKVAVDPLACPDHQVIVNTVISPRHPDQNISRSTGGMVSRGLENDTNFKSYTQNTIAPVASSLLRLLFLYFLQKLLLPSCYYHLHSHYPKTLFYSSFSSSYRHYSICFSSCSTSPHYTNFFTQSTAFSPLLLPRFLQPLLCSLLQRFI